MSIVIIKLCVYPSTRRLQRLYRFRDFLTRQLLPSLSCAVLHVSLIANFFVEHPGDAAVDVGELVFGNLALVPVRLQC